MIGEELQLRVARGQSVEERGLADTDRQVGASVRYGCAVQGESDRARQIARIDEAIARAVGIASGCRGRIQNEVGCQISVGEVDDAAAKLTIPFPVAVKTVVEGDQQAGMQAFMSGQVKVEGDMSVMMRMQGAGPPSPQAQALQNRIKEITEA